MSILHGVTDGDVPGTVSSGSFASMVCNCACSRCMNGSCCMFPAPAVWEQPIVTTTTSTPTFVTSCGPIDHDFAVFDPARLFCRKCGTTRTVG